MWPAGGRVESYTGGGIVENFGEKKEMTADDSLKMKAHNHYIPLSVYISRPFFKVVKNSTKAFKTEITGLYSD